MGGNKDAWLIKVSSEPEITANTPTPGTTETLTAAPTQALTAVPGETSTVSPPEKAAGFEVYIVITALLFVTSIRRNRR